MYVPLSQLKSKHFKISIFHNQYPKQTTTTKTNKKPKKQRKKEKEFGKQIIENEIQNTNLNKVKNNNSL